MAHRLGCKEATRTLAPLLLALSLGWLLGRGDLRIWQIPVAWAGVLGLALLGIRWRATSLSRAAEQERRRLSAALHDGVATQLASLTWSLSALRRRQARGAAAPRACALHAGGEALDDVSQGSGRVVVEPALVDELLKLEHNLRGVQAELRRVVLDLRSPERTLGAWSEQLERRVCELGASYGAAHDRRCQVVLKLSGAVSRQISGAVAEQLERAVLEGVYNALRHADCKNICVDITAGAGIEIEIRDDGIGMSNANVERGGLANLRTGARTLSGELSVLSGSQGTRLRLSVPSLAA